MADKQPTIYMDSFSKKLVEVFIALVKKGAIKKKKDYVELVGSTSPNFVAIEKSTRNYPADAGKRSVAIMKLYDVYGVNPDFMRDKSKKMFLREPEVLERATPLKAAELNFANKQEKRKILDELAACQQTNADLQATIKRLQQELDKKQGKKTDK